MTSPRDGNAREMILLAERELALGHFIKATRLSRKASKVIDRLNEVHKRFIDLWKKGEARLKDYEDKGYDVTEARSVLRTAREMAIKSDYESAIGRMRVLDRALNRATYLPFPLLNRNVDIITTAFWAGTHLSYTVKVENPSMTEPLGEMIIRPDVEEGVFRDVSERLYGNIEPRHWYEWTFNLIPLRPDWRMGLDSDIFKEGGMVFRSRFSSRGGKATYSVTVENNNDQIIRDIGLVPNPPGGLVPTPPSAFMEFVEPFGSKTVEFDLTPPSLGAQAETDKGDRVVMAQEIVEMDEDDYGPGAGEDEDGATRQDTFQDEKAYAPVRGEMTFDEDLESWEDEESSSEDEGPKPVRKEPKDFTPQEEEYDLMVMSPYAYPDSVRSGSPGPFRPDMEEEDEELEGKE